jgi:hypothetical protein
MLKVCKMDDNIKDLQEVEQYIRGELNQDELEAFG